MKMKEIVINKNIINTCQLPKDVLWGASIISLTGNTEMIVENFKNILKFQSELLIVQCKNYQIEIKGKNLMIEQYSKEELKILGKISEIKFM